MSKHRFLLGWVVGVAVLVMGSLGISERSSDAAERQAETLVTRSYRTADLPIWNENGKRFDHLILIALIKANINEDAWNDSHSVVPYPQDVSLVVSTTVANHDVIAKTLDQLRLDRFKQSPEFKRSVK